MRVFQHVLLKHGHENADMQKQKFDDATLQYSMGKMLAVANCIPGPYLKTSHIFSKHKATVDKILNESD